MSYLNFRVGRGGDAFDSGLGIGPNTAWLNSRVDPFLPTDFIAPVFSDIGGLHRASGYLLLELRSTAC